MDRRHGRISDHAKLVDIEQVAVVQPNIGTHQNRGETLIMRLKYCPWLNY